MLTQFHQTGEANPEWDGTGYATLRDIVISSLLPRENGKGR